MTNHSTLVRDLEIEELTAISGGEMEEIVITAPRRREFDGGMYGGGWFALGVGVHASGGGGSAHGSAGAGFGGGFSVGYSSDRSTARNNGDKTNARYGVSVDFDLDPFTIGIDFNSGVFVPVVEKHNN